MKTYPAEIEIFSSYSVKRPGHPELTAHEKASIHAFLKARREVRFTNKRTTAVIETLPLIVLATIWAFLVFALPALIQTPITFMFVFGVLHGILGYSYVVYTLHQGAGHQLFSNVFLRKLAFHSSRLLFADPVQYQVAHSSHHRNLGQATDGAFTHYVLPNRIFKSLLPGAGVLFPNDYKIHQGELYTRSRFISDWVGLSFLILEIYWISKHHAWFWTVPALVLIAPWVGSVLDRIRESIEHQLMPGNPQYGTREFGTGFWGMLWGGGPWGQPCHFSHHFAPDLHWLDQLRFHRFLKKNLSPQFLEYYGFNAAPTPRFVVERLKIALRLHDQMKGKAV